MLYLLGSVFIASLLGSLHCVGMCGPFALLAGADAEKRSAMLGPTVAYSVGRLITYSVIGAIFGGLGLALNHSVSLTQWNDWQQSATFAAGALMVVVGLISLARYFGKTIPLPSGFAPAMKLLQVTFQSAQKLPPISRSLVIGCLTSLMPCGWLYTFAITAAGTASPLWGMILMATFWAGTVPIMSALMLGFRHVGQRLQKRLPAVMACLVVVIGVLTMAHRSSVVLGKEPGVVSGVQELTEQVSSAHEQELPCCHCVNSAGSGTQPQQESAGE